MSVTLEVIFAIAAVALIVLAICLIPLAFLAWRQLSQLALAVELVKADVDVLLRDSREMVHSISDLSKRANAQMDDLGKVVHTAEVWTERVDWVAKLVGSAVEPPVATVVRKVGILRKGVGAFLQVLVHPRRQRQTAKEKSDV